MNLYAVILWEEGNKEGRILKHNIKKDHLESFISGQSGEYPINRLTIVKQISFRISSKLTSIGD